MSVLDPKKPLPRQELLIKQRADLYVSVKAISEFIADSPEFKGWSAERQAYYRQLRNTGIQTLIMLHSRIEGDNSRRSDFADLIRPMEKES